MSLLRDNKLWGLSEYRWMGWGSVAVDRRAWSNFLAQNLECLAARCGVCTQSATLRALYSTAMPVAAPVCSITTCFDWAAVEGVMATCLGCVDAQQGRHLSVGGRFARRCDIAAATKF